jgi:hypothetical protein
MNQPETIYQWSDTWLLLAVGCQLSLEEIPLSVLITRADAIQHAVPSFDEVDGGLARLSIAGLVRVIDGRVALTPSGLELISHTATPRRALLQWQEELGRVLKASRWSADYATATARREPWVHAVVSQMDYQKALRDSGR